VYNEQGYQFTVATQRPYWISWVSPFRVDPSRLTLHKMDELAAETGWVFIRTKFMQAGGAPASLPLTGACRTLGGLQHPQHRRRHLQASSRLCVPCATSHDGPGGRRRSAARWSTL
jgi:hypothetical protein